MEPETGPPIGDPPIHTHEEPAITEVVEEVADEADELLEEITATKKIAEETRRELAEKIDTCRTQLERLSQIQPAENPMLTQLLNQMIEIRAELANLKSSLDSKVNLQTQRESEQILVEVPPADEKTVESTGEPSGESVEPEKKRRATFV